MNDKNLTKISDDDLESVQGGIITLNTDRFDGVLNSIKKGIGKTEEEDQAKPDKPISTNVYRA